MLSVIATVCLAAPSATPIIWADAWQLSERDVAVPENGTYAVWVWAPEGGGSIRVGSRTLAANASGWGWAKAGEVNLSAGTIDVRPTEGVAAIAMSTDREFDPARSQADRRVLDTPDTVGDLRTARQRHTNYVFSMPRYESLEEWESYAEGLRRRILVANGLLPLYERTPLRARIFDGVTRDGYTVEKVHFEASPGFLCTGNLYRPIGDGPFPGVAAPHGHWPKGRLENSEECSVAGRCITLARMGIVAFAYDMIGYVDSLQFGHGWGSQSLSLWGIQPFSFQLWTSMRVLDFLESLPDVDNDRLGCTGASGGGTQAFALTAVDPRVKVAAPVNMISRSMQGGCLCENAPLLRTDNSNIEIGALMAPRPLLMISASGDWTLETPTYEFPMTRTVYALYGAEDRVANVHVDAPHNYNQDSREAMYRFFGKWILDDPKDWSDFSEPAFEVEPEEARRVFPDGKLPADLPSKDEIIGRTIEAARRKWERVLPSSAEALDGFKKTYGVALHDVLVAEPPHPRTIDPERKDRIERDGHILERWVLRRPSSGEAIPALVYVPEGTSPADAVVLAHGDGKAAFANLRQGGPGELVTGLLESGRMVVAIDTFLQGEHHSPFAVTERPEVGVLANRQALKAWETFEPTNTAWRVQDVLTAVAYARDRVDCTGRVDVVGLGDAGLWCLFAAALDPEIRNTWADMNGFDPDDDAAWVEKHYVPSICSVGDVATAAAMVAPRSLWLADAEKAAPRVSRVYNDVGAADRLSIVAASPDVPAIVRALQ